jgi:manganese-dependent ADP-ribose/CDP-alcohol diphosphatase
MNHFAIIEFILRKKNELFLNSYKFYRLQNLKFIVFRMLYNSEVESIDREETQNTTSKPLVTFGILTDIQYADVENGTSYDKKRIRYYRNSLELTKEAVSNWRLHELNNNLKMKFIIQLGDIIDLKAGEKNESLSSLEKVLTELNRLFDDSSKETQLLHIWGNHELYNFMRHDLVKLPINTAKALGQNLETNANYYTYNVTDKLRLVCLDFYQFSLLGYDESDERYQSALNLIRKHNKNDNLNSYENMRGHALRFCKFNGI